MKIGILHPGAMGSTIAAAAALNGIEVSFASDGRSEATRERAASSQLHDAGSLKDLVSRSDLILSVCPPASALDLARRVAALEFSGIYVDANAVSPETARRIAAVVEKRALFVDGRLGLNIVMYRDQQGVLYVFTSEMNQADLVELVGSSDLLMQVNERLRRK